MTRFNPKTFAILLSLICLAAVGCGSAGEGVLVAGAVTYNGQPIDQGEIIFTPAESSKPSVAGQIAAGKYECQIPPGRNQVRITAYREVPGKVDRSNPGEESPVVEMYLPDQYNARSTLEVSVDQPNAALDFPLGKT